MRRIIGQCNQATFSSLEHLARVIEEGFELDTSTLSRSQNLACQFCIMCRDKGIPWKLLRSAIREVLFWGEYDDAETIEIKFLQKPKSVGEFRSKWNG
jgi:hypothetical protein